MSTGGGCQHLARLKDHLDYVLVAVVLGRFKRITGKNENVHAVRLLDRRRLQLC